MGGGGGDASWALEVIQAVFKSGFKFFLDIFVDFMNILTIKGVLKQN